MLPTFEFKPFQENEDAKAARQFRIAQTLDALSRAVATLADEGYATRAEHVLNYIDQILPEEKLIIENGKNKLNKRAKPVQGVTSPVSGPDQSKGEDAGTEGSEVGRPTGNDAINVRGKKVTPKPAPDIKSKWINLFSFSKSCFEKSRSSWFINHINEKRRIKALKIR